MRLFGEGRIEYEEVGEQKATKNFHSFLTTSLWLCYAQNDVHHDLSVQQTKNELLN